MVTSDLLISILTTKHVRSVLLVGSVLDDLLPRLLRPASVQDEFPISRFPRLLDELSSHSGSSGSSGGSTVDLNDASGPPSPGRTVCGIHCGPPTQPDLRTIGVLTQSPATAEPARSLIDVTLKSHKGIPRWHSLDVMLLSGNVAVTDERLEGFDAIIADERLFQDAVARPALLNAFLGRYRPQIFVAACCDDSSSVDLQSWCDEAGQSRGYSVSFFPIGGKDHVAVFERRSSQSVKRGRGGQQRMTAVAFGGSGDYSSLAAPAGLRYSSPTSDLLRGRSASLSLAARGDDSVNDRGGDHAASDSESDKDSGRMGRAARSRRPEVLPWLSSPTTSPESQSRSTSRRSYSETSGAYEGVSPCPHQMVWMTTLPATPGRSGKPSQVARVSYGPARSAFFHAQRTKIMPLPDDELETLVRSRLAASAPSNWVSSSSSASGSRRKVSAAVSFDVVLADQEIIAASAGRFGTLLDAMRLTSPADGESDVSDSSGVAEPSKARSVSPPHRTSSPEYDSESADSARAASIVEGLERAAIDNSPSPVSPQGDVDLTSSVTTVRPNATPPESSTPSPLGPATSPPSSIPRGLIVASDGKRWQLLVCRREEDERDETTLSEDSCNDEHAPESELPAVAAANLILVMTLRGAEAGRWLAERKTTTPSAFAA